MSTRFTKRLIMLLITFFTWPVLSMSDASSEAHSAYNMPEGVTSISHQIYHLHMTIFWVCVCIGIGVFSVMFYAIINHRKSKGVKPATFHENIWVEIIWAVIPTLILIAMAIPATQVLMHMDDTTEADINIKITGYQWKWRYDYLDEGFGFFSTLSTPYKQIHNQEPKGKWYLLEVDKPLVVPVHKKIRFLITANDVIHSWWVPALGIKQDGVPGFIHDAWTVIDTPGIYRGQCTELCGMNHGYMPIVVKALSEPDYAQWLKSHTGRTDHAGNSAEMKRIQANLNKPMSLTALMQEGETAYLKHCVVCHQSLGQGMPPAFPAIAGSPIATGPLKAHVDIILNGKPGTAMQAFGEQLNNRELAAIISYQRHAWGNDNLVKLHGHQAMIQPKAVAEAKKSN